MNKEQLHAWLMANEDSLSDGYCYYLPRTDTDANGWYLSEEVREVGDRLRRLIEQTWPVDA